MDRQELIELVRRITSGTTDDEEQDALIAELRSHVVDPHVIGYIFHPLGEADLTPEQIVDKALAYRPIAL